MGPSQAELKLGSMERCGCVKGLAQTDMAVVQRVAQRHPASHKAVQETRVLLLSPDSREVSLGIGGRVHSSTRAAFPRRVAAGLAPHAQGQREHPRHLVQATDPNASGAALHKVRTDQVIPTQPEEDRPDWMAKSSGQPKPLF